MLLATPEINSSILNDPFVRANKAMEIIANSIPGIEPIRPSDVSLFNQFYAHEQLMGRETHGNSFSYILQMLNRVGSVNMPHIGYRYTDNESIIPIIVYPQKSSPQNLGVYFVRPTGTQTVDKVSNLAANIRHLGCELPIFVKKIFPDQAEALLNCGFSTIDSLPWHPSSPKEDDTFPEQIFDVDRTLNIAESAKKGRSIRNALIAHDRLSRRHEINITDDEFTDKAWSLTLAHFQNVAELGKNTANLSSPYDYINMIFHNPSRQGLTKKIIEVDGAAAGYYITERVPNSNYTNFYALMTQRQFTGLGDYAMIHIFQECQTPYINTGGSEYKNGMRDFLGKYSPVAENRMEWVVKVD